MGGNGAVIIGVAFTVKTLGYSKSGACLFTDSLNRK